MATVAKPRKAKFKNVADLIHRLGNIPPERIRMVPFPGTATEQDLLEALDGPQKVICELIDGVLVEKTAGITESFLAALIATFLNFYLFEHDLGIVLGADGTLRFRIGLVRVPDVSFISWERLPNEEVPREPIASVIPDLAVEVISTSNTAAEMECKLKDFFKAGVRLAWLIYPITQTAEIYTSPTKKRDVDLAGSLDGGAVLPGFSLKLTDLFDRVKRRRKRGR